METSRYARCKTWTSWSGGATSTRRTASSVKWDTCPTKVIIQPHGTGIIITISPRTSDPTDGPGSRCTITFSPLPLRCASRSRISGGAPGRYRRVARWACAPRTCSSICASTFPCNTNFAWDCDRSVTSRRPSGTTVTKSTGSRFGIGPASGRFGSPSTSPSVWPGTWWTPPCRRTCWTLFSRRGSTPRSSSGRGRKYSPTSVRSHLRPQTLRNCVDPRGLGRRAPCFCRAFSLRRRSWRNCIGRPPTRSGSISTIRFGGGTFCGAMAARRGGSCDVTTS